MRLLHYTCDHALPMIQRDWMLKPNPVSYRQLIWLTDLETPNAQGLGLTMMMLKCDRTAHKVVVETDAAVRWTTWAHEQKVPLEIRLGLDAAEGAMPLRWWVSQVPIPVVDIMPTR